MTIPWTDSQILIVGCVMPCDWLFPHPLSFISPTDVNAVDYDDGGDDVMGGSSSSEDMLVSYSGNLSDRDREDNEAAFAVSRAGWWWRQPSSCCWSLWSTLNPMPCNCCEPSTRWMLAVAWSHGPTSWPYSARRMGQTQSFLSMPWH